MKIELYQTGRVIRVIKIGYITIGLCGILEFFTDDGEYMGHYKPCSKHQGVIRIRNETIFIKEYEEVRIVGCCCHGIDED